MDFKEFSINNFKNISLADSADLISQLISSEEEAIDFCFANLYIYGGSNGSCWQNFNGRIYIWLKKYNYIMFTKACDMGPKPEELKAVSEAMKAGGNPCTFWEVCTKYVETYPEVADYFKVEPVPESYRGYIYSVKTLVELEGRDLAYKRSLIRQFHESHPNIEICPIEQGKIFADCKALAVEWRSTYPDQEDESLDQEADAIAHLTDGFKEMGAEGIAIYENGEILAFYIFARLNKDMYTGLFSKSKSDCRGIQQVIKQEAAKALIGKCSYLNEDSDLGLPGLRQAKRSYLPIRILENQCLYPI